MRFMTVFSGLRSSLNSKPLGKEFPMHLPKKVKQLLDNKGMSKSQFRHHTLDKLLTCIIWGGKKSLHNLKTSVV